MLGHVNEYREVAGQYCSSNSPYELLPGLLDMRRRMELLDKVGLLGARFNRGVCISVLTHAWIVAR